jgi:4,5-DOPA dioxygenase extradiol
MNTSLDDIFNPSRPAGAYDDLLAEVLPAAHARPAWTPHDGALPALFVSHGAPPTLDDAAWLRDLFSWGQSLPQPRGIVVVSAHWENAPLAVTNINAATPLYYDFGGFHPRYYTLQYRTPDATELAQRILGTFSDTTTVHHFPTRGLDHGAFIPLMAMYPAADVPVIQVSMPSLDPAALHALGRRLKPLRQEGYLVVGSGFMTHSFAAMRHPELIGPVREFDAWAAEAIARRDIDSLIDFRTKGPGAHIAHPTADHFVPLLLTLSAGDGESDAPRTVIEREVMGNSIRSIQAA